MTEMRWPKNKQFALTIFDDTDGCALEELVIIYKFLYELGFRTTKSVWTLKASEAPVCPGATCEDSDYLVWLKEIKDAGFEIGLHNVAAGSSTRDRIKKGLDQFARHFGHQPYIHANHANNLENVYWGLKRFGDPLVRATYSALAIRKNRHFCGDEEGNPYFWGDLCKQRIRYIRNLVFREINTLSVCPIMPYHDPQKPFVNYWFASSNGRDADTFTRLLQSIDDLQQEGGASIIYTHFADGFVCNGKLHSGFERVMREVAGRPGWFVPAGELLDWLKDSRPPTTPMLARSALVRMERRWLAQRILAGGGH